MPLKIHDIPPVEILRKHFRIDEHWRLQRKFGTTGWKLASKIYSDSGYFVTVFKGKHYLAHRIIWTMHYGLPPSALIDHINGQKWDNRIENLREATHAQNRWNSARSGRRVKPSFGGYAATVTACGRAHKTPVFDDQELAELAGDELARRLHGEFAYQNREAA